MVVKREPIINKKITKTVLTYKLGHRMPGLVVSMIPRLQ